MKADGTQAKGGGLLRREEGIALALTVWALAILALIGGEFMLSTRLRLKADIHVAASSRSYALALAGYEAALEALGPDLRGLSRGEDKDLLLYIRGQDDGVPAKVEKKSLGTGSYSWTVDDEDGKVDINRQPRNILADLLGAAGLESGVERDTIVDSIMDWRDPNREHHLNGAEEDYYRRLERPYSCKDGPFETAAELLLVRGMTEDLFYGTADEEGNTVGPLEDWVTVYPVVFNIATAPAEVLDIVGKPRPAGMKRISQYYRVTATGHSEEGVERSVRAVVRREARGSAILFSLLYWDDNFLSRQRSADALE